VQTIQSSETLTMPERPDLQMTCQQMPHSTAANRPAYNSTEQVRLSDARELM